MPAPSRADFAAGQAAYERGDYPRAASELVPAADTSAAAAVMLAEIYARGLIGPPDAQQALLWLRHAAELGDPGAQLRLGDYYASGSEQDRREAIEWYRRAAEQGTAAAQYALGKTYEQGAGTPPDNARAAEHMQSAALAGHDGAAAWLADAYEHGVGVAPDPTQAERWRREAHIAPDRGVEDARVASQDDADRYCNVPHRYECERLWRERNWRLRYGFDWYSDDHWHGHRWDPFWPAWGYGRPYAGWGWSPWYGRSRGWSFGFSFGF
jgi:TPR repeat protein